MTVATDDVLWNDLLLVAQKAVSVIAEITEPLASSIVYAGLNCVRGSLSSVIVGALRIVILPCYTVQVTTYPHNMCHFLIQDRRVISRTGVMRTSGKAQSVTYTVATRGEYIMPPRLFCICCQDVQ